MLYLCRSEELCYETRATATATRSPPFPGNDTRSTTNVRGQLLCGEAIGRVWCNRSVIGDYSLLFPFQKSLQILQQTCAHIPRKSEKAHLTAALRRLYPRAVHVMHSLLSSPVGRIAACLLALLTNGVFHTGEGALEPNPGSHLSSSSFQHTNNCNNDNNDRQPHQKQQHHHHPRRHHHHHRHHTQIADLVVRISGGANANNSRRRKHHASRLGQGQHGDHGAGLPDAVEVSGADHATDRANREAHLHLDGVYLREWDVNGAPHFKRRSKVNQWRGVYE